MKPRSLAAPAVALFASWLSVGSASAAQFFWDSPAGGSFDDPANWLGAIGPPGAGDDAFFDLDATYTVQFGSDEGGPSVEVLDGDVTFDLAGLHGVVAPWGVISVIGGLFPSDGASLTLVGGTLEASVYFGYDGAPRRLRVADGATLYAHSIQGGDGASLEVISGGVVVGGRVDLGDSSPDVSQGLIDGAGSLLVASDLGAGRDGTADVTIRNGGMLISSEGAIGEGYFADGSAQLRVDGPGSLWSNFETLRVGSHTDGTLRIDNGARVTTREAFAGRWGAGEIEMDVCNMYGSGHIAISGAGSLLRASEALVLGGDLGFDRSDPVGLPPGGIGDLVLSAGGRAEVGQLWLWNGSHADVGGGRLDVGARSLPAVPSGLAVHRGGRFGGAGTVIGDVSLRGRLDPGGWDGAAGIDPRLWSSWYSDGLPFEQPPGRLLNVEGSLSAQQTAELVFDVAIGTAPEAAGESYDAIAVSGAVLLAGRLSVNVLPEAALDIASGDVLTILTASNGLSGTFANVASGGLLADEAGGGVFSVFYGAGSPYGVNQVVLTGFQPACSDGIDDDLDGLIDFGSDPGCSNAVDTSERQPGLPCDDGLDNDGDRRIDFPTDLGCLTSVATREAPQCQDGVNNDSAVGIDFDGGASLDLNFDGFIDPQFNAAAPAVGAVDPECLAPWWNREDPSGCGLGFELVALVPLLAHLRRRRTVRATARQT